MRDAGVGPSLQVLPVFEQSYESGSKESKLFSSLNYEAIHAPFDKGKSVSPACRSPCASSDQQQEAHRERRS
jgi:hypothetical protein